MNILPAEQELAEAEVVFDLSEGAFAAVLAGGVGRLRLGSGHALGMGFEAVIVFVAVDCAVLRLRAEALRAERAGRTNAGLRGVTIACLRAGGELFGRVFAVLQELTERAPKAVVDLVKDEGRAGFVVGSASLLGAKSVMPRSSRACRLAPVRDIVSAKTSAGAKTRVGLAALACGRYPAKSIRGTLVSVIDPSPIPFARHSSMILSGSEIHARLGSDIVIDPFQESQLNPNSYNLRLHNELLVYEEIVLDMRRPNRHRRIEIPPEGIELNPSQLYLGRTMERTETHNLVPMLEGRSSVGRLGLFVHVTAGFGDVGFCGYWTLEMYAVQPVRIYPGVEICQIFYHTIEGAIREYDTGKYQHNTDIQPSLLYTELQSKEDRQRRLWDGP